MSTPLTDIIDRLDALLRPGDYKDFGVNGLQVPGPAHVERVVTGVSAQLELFERAVELDADLVVVHHGMFWEWEPRRIDRATAARLELLLDHDIGLAMYHLPLDAHMEVGNNALLATELGADAVEPWGLHEGMTIGVKATFAGGIASEDLVRRVERATRREPFVWPFGPDVVRTLGILSGSGAMEGGPWIGDAIELGFDGYLTGEPTEHTMAQAKESGIHFIAAGHYATETFGVRRLGELLAAEFGVEAIWVDIPNPI